MPKLYHPEITSFSVGGKTYEADKKGAFTFDDDAVGEAIAFGFTSKKDGKAGPEPAQAQEVAQPDAQAEGQPEVQAEAQGEGEQPAAAAAEEQAAAE